MYSKNSGSIATTSGSAGADSGLTPEQIEEIARSCWELDVPEAEDFNYTTFARAIEREVLATRAAADLSGLTREQIIEASGNALLQGEVPGTIEYDLALIREASSLATTKAAAAQDDAVAMLKYVLPHINPRAADVKLARKGPMEDAYINTIARRFIERADQPSPSVPRVASIDTPEFLALAERFAHESGCEEFNELAYNAARAALVTYVNAHIARQSQAVSRDAVSPAYSAPDLTKHAMSDGEKTVYLDGHRSGWRAATVALKGQPAGTHPSPSSADVRNAAVTEQRMRENEEDIEIALVALKSAGRCDHWPTNMRHRINVALYEVDRARAARLPPASNEKGGA